MREKDCLLTTACAASSHSIKKPIRCNLAPFSSSLSSIIPVCPLVIFTHPQHHLKTKQMHVFALPHTHTHAHACTHTHTQTLA